MQVQVAAWLLLVQVKNCDTPGFIGVINANDRISRVKPADTGQT
jgi:hypothetical protein